MSKPESLELDELILLPKRTVALLTVDDVPTLSEEYGAVAEIQLDLRELRQASRQVHRDRRLAGAG